MAEIRIELFLAYIVKSGYLTFMKYDIDFTFVADIQNFLRKIYLK